MKCSQMPEGGLFTIVRSSGGFVKVFVDARGAVSLQRFVKDGNGSVTVRRSRAVRCQLCIPLAGS